MRQPWVINDAHGNRIDCSNADDVARQLGDMLGRPVSKASVHNRCQWMYFAMIRAGVTLTNPHLPLRIPWPLTKEPGMGLLRSSPTTPRLSRVDYRRGN